MALHVCAGSGRVCDAEACLPFTGCGIELPSPEEVMQEGGPWQGALGHLELSIRAWVPSLLVLGTSWDCLLGSAPISGQQLVLCR